ncbi:hypothetical protein [Okeania hirsuta]
MRIEEESFHLLKLSEADDENFSLSHRSRAKVVLFAEAPEGG